MIEEGQEDEEEVEEEEEDWERYINLLEEYLIIDHLFLYQ